MVRQASNVWTECRVCGSIIDHPTIQTKHVDAWLIVSYLTQSNGPEFRPAKALRGGSGSGSEFTLTRVAMHPLS